MASDPSAPTSHAERAARRIGTVLKGKYTLDAVLGVGGMASVYSATHRNGNKVAIKVLHAEISADEDLRARFLREGYVANSVLHSGAVRVLDDDVAEDGAAFIVMELLSGETLRARAARLGGKLPHEEVAAIADALLATLEAAHAQGIVHRDLKPENLLLTTDGALKVLDFGVARMRDPSGSGASRTGRVMGTPAFMPPEQVLGRADEIDGRADLWACGATMFTLCTGRQVHEAHTPEEVLVRTATQPVPPVASTGAGIAPPIAAVIDRALSFAREERFADAREMRAALEQARLASFGALRALPSAQRVDSPEALGSAPTLNATGDDASFPGDRAASTRLSARPASAARGSRRAWIGALVLVVSAAAASRLVTRPSVGSASVPAAIASVASSPTARCATNADCSVRDAGGPVICRKDTGACVSLESDQCKTLRAEPGDVENDATIWVGLMVGKIATNERFVDEVVNTADLARRDFVAVSSGIPGARPDARPRPLGLLVCDDSTEPEAAARHLVDDVGVPAVIGFSRTKEVADLTASLFNPRGVLALAALNSAPMLASVPNPPGGPRLLWRTTASSGLAAATEAAFVGGYVAPKAKLASGEPLRVAVVRLANNNQLDHADKFVSLLKVGGKGVAEGGASIRQFLLDVDHPAKDHADVKRGLLELRPHVILDLYRDDGFTEDLFPEMERAWPAGVGLPTYVLFGSSTLEGDPLLRFVTGHASARDRIFASDVSVSRPATSKLAIHYDELYPVKITAATTEPGPYDAVYLLAYAAASLGDQPLTGVALAKAIPRLLPPGPKLEVGPSSILEAFNALRSGRNIDLEGAMTTLDFDLETGDAPAPQAIFCLRATPDRRSFQSAESGLTYDDRVGTIQGTLRCR